MSSVDKQLLFSAYEVASLYVYNMLQPTYQDFNWCLIDNQVDKNEDHYAHLEIYTNHNIYKDMTKDLLQSISNTSQCINPTDIGVQQFSRPFLLDWFKNKGLECPALCLPFNKKKVHPQKPAKNITININNTHKNTTKNKSDVEVSQSSNIMQKKEKMEPHNMAIILSAYDSEITINTGQKNNKVTIAKIFGRKTKQCELFLAIAKANGLLSETDFKRTCSGSSYSTRTKLLSELNKTFENYLSLKKKPFNTTQGGITTIFKEIRKAKSKNVGTTGAEGFYEYDENNPDAAGNEFFDEQENKL